MQIKSLKLQMEKFKPNLKSKRIGWLTLVCIAIAFSCNNEKNNSGKDRNTANPDSVEVVSGYGRVGSLNEITEITTEINGIVENIFHEPGDTLSLGDTIFSLNHEDEQIRVNQMEAELQSVTIAIALLDEQIETAEKTTETRREYLERLEKSLEAGTASQQNVDNARLEAEQAEGQLNELVIEKKRRMQEYAIQEEALKQQMLTLGKHFIQSPDDGIVLSLDVEKNMPVQAMQSYGEFRFAGPYSITAEIDELYAGEIKKDMKAHAVPYGREDTIAFGHITFVSPKLQEKSMFSEESDGFMDRRVREVEMRIDSTAEDILIGERVNLIIETK